jgi:septum formation protein
MLWAGETPYFAGTIGIMFETTSSLILASGSPRRRRFLENLGLEFKTAAADVDESHRAGELPGEFVCRLAEAKASAVTATAPESWVIGADTVVVLGGEILGKPADPEQALIMLKRLQGRTHEVWTGVSVLRGRDRITRTFAVRTEVTFAEASESVLAAYVATGEPLDKAGAYGIQDLGVFLVSSLNGSYSNVVGLPLPELLGQLLDLGVIRPS